jgi:uncharacterized phage infection (PIP) family protein YhgE
MTEQQLLQLKRQVDEAKSTVNQLKGHKQALMKQLNDDWACNTIEEAEKKLSKMDKEIDDLDSQINEGIKKLEEEDNE